MSVEEEFRCKCGRGHQIRRHTRSGRVFFGCTAYPRCEITYSPKDVRRAKWPDEATKFRCECGSLMRLKWSKLYNQPFYGCDSFPRCSNTFAASDTGGPLPGEDRRPQPTEKPPNAVESYPCKCGGHQKLKWSPRNRMWFYGCSHYPMCRKTRSVEEVYTVWDSLREEEGDISIPPPTPPSKTVAEQFYSTLTE